jgi:hypothetical protein
VNALDILGAAFQVWLFWPKVRLTWKGENVFTSTNLLSRRDRKMPRATVNKNELEHKMLKSLPEGFVDLQRMSYGEKLARQGMTSKMRITASKGKNFEGELDMLQKEVSYYEFAHCIVDHNLEDERGQKLDFRQSYNVDALDGKVGEEISTYISEMNNFEEDDTGEDSTASGPQ